MTPPRASVPSFPLRTDAAMQRGQSIADLIEALPAEVRTGLARMENRRKHGHEGDSVVIFAVPAAPFLWWRDRWQQVRATDVPGHLLAGTPVRVQVGELTEARDLITGRRYRISVVSSRGYLVIHSLPALTGWVRGGCELPSGGETCGWWCKLVAKLAAPPQRTR